MPMMNELMGWPWSEIAPEDTLEMFKDMLAEMPDSWLRKPFMQRLGEKVLEHIAELGGGEHGTDH